MSEGDATHARRPPGRRLRRVTAGLVVLVLLLAGASYQFDLGPRWFGFNYPDPVTDPDKVPPPPGLTLPETQDAALVAMATRLRGADPEGVRRAVARLAHRPKLGPDVAIAVAQLNNGEVVYQFGDERVIPASTLKLLTGAAALAALGPEHRFRTSVVSGDRNWITLVGGGDPLLERAPLPAEDGYPPRADITTLAEATASALRSQGRTRVRLRYDDTLFEGPAISPHWEPSYVPGNVVTPVSALWVDEGLVSEDSARRSRDPAEAAAHAFAAELRERNIKVVGRPEAEAAPADATELAAVESAPLGQIVQRILDVSDNEGAEVLARHVAIAAGLPGSFESIAEAYELVLGELGVDTSGSRIFDGSGLSRDNRLRPETLLQLMEVAADPGHPELRPVLTGLPVAGFTGSLTYRFETGDSLGLGAVRAKTGTLSRVHGLAGTVTTQDGVVLAFVAAADKVKVPNTLDARAILDEVGAALAACTCAEPG